MMDSVLLKPARQHPDSVPAVQPKHPEPVQLPMEVVVVIMMIIHPVTG
jgi:hypothetical protein